MKILSAFLFGFSAIGATAHQSTAAAQDNAAGIVQCEARHLPRTPVDHRARGGKRLSRGCDAEALYYGENRTRNVQAARICALRNPTGGHSLVLRNSLVLMQIYANGRGVKRNANLAINYACASELGSEQKSAIIKAIRAAKAGGDQVDYCDFADTEIETTLCLERDARVNATPRNRTLARIVAAIPRFGRENYQELKRRFDEYEQARMEEIDTSGSDRGEKQISEREGLAEDFVNDLERLVSGKLPLRRLNERASDASVARAVTNVVHRVEKNYDERFSKDLVAGVNRGQNAWLAYRNAFLRFARNMRTPAQHSLRYVLNEERVARLAYTPV